MSIRLSRAGQDDTWIGGEDGDGHAEFQHWNGQSWQTVSAGGWIGTFNGIDALPDDTIIANGIGRSTSEGFTVRCNSATEECEAQPFPPDAGDGHVISGISAGGDDSVWMVGTIFHADDTDEDVAMRLDGQNPVRVDLPPVCRPVAP